MAFIKYLVPALAVASLSVAQNCDGKITIENQSDASGLSSCQKIDGDVIIDPKVENAISLDGVQEITGSLDATGAVNMTSLAAGQLTTIGDSFTLLNTARLTNLQFDNLEEVGEVNFEGCPVLQQLNFAKEISKASKVRITNTYLTTLQGINLETVGNFEITNNPKLKEVDVDQITNITGTAIFSANHKDLRISFPNLESVRNISVRNASTVQFPSLKSTEGLFGLYSNYIEEFLAGNLTQTGDLVFADNSALTNLSLPVLETVKGAFQVANNSMLKSIDAAPKLKTVSGALDFSGSFSKVDLPSLESVDGGVNLQTSSEFDCGSFNDEVAGGDVTCKPKAANPTTKDGSSGTGSGSAATTSDFGTNIAPPAGLSMFALILGAFAL